MLGGSLATLVSVFNPELLVIGGGIARAGEYVLAAIREAIYRRALPLATHSLRIEISTVDEDVAGVTGAVQLAVGQLFSREHLSVWLDQRTPAGRPEVAELPVRRIPA